MISEPPYLNIGDGETSYANNRVFRSIPFPVVESEEHSFLFALELSAGAIKSMVLKSAIELGLLELIKEADHASASELVAKLPTNNPDAISMVDRILRLLATYSILNCTLVKVSNDGDIERRYSLGPVCKYLTKNSNGVSVLSSMLLLIHGRAFMESWYHLSDAVVEGGIPFDKAHGAGVFDYADKNPIYNNLLNTAMGEYSAFLMKKIVESYKGFEGVKSLVDVGGGNGATLHEIRCKYPLIKGINFDLPHVIRNAPSYPGVEHVSGDMFVRVPRADAIFMKSICHDWSDAHCEKLLKNCYEAIPENGKVIIAEFMIHDDPRDGASFAARYDMVMLAVNAGGKERTEMEFETMAKRAGFQKFHKECYAFGIWVMELYK